MRRVIMTKRGPWKAPRFSPEFREYLAARMDALNEERREKTYAEMRDYILYALSVHANLSAYDIQQTVGRYPSLVYKMLYRMEMDGLIKPLRCVRRFHIGHGRPARRWRITSAGLVALKK